MLPDPLKMGQKVEGWGEEKRGGCDMAVGGWTPLCGTNLKVKVVEARQRLQSLRPDVGKPVVAEIERAQVNERCEYTLRQVRDLIMGQVELRHGHEASKRRHRDVLHGVAAQKQRLYLHGGQTVRRQLHDEVLRHVHLWTTVDFTVSRYNCMSFIHKTVNSQPCIVAVPRHDEPCTVFDDTVNAILDMEITTGLMRTILSLGKVEVTVSQRLLCLRHVQLFPGELKVEEVRKRVETHEGAVNNLRKHNDRELS